LFREEALSGDPEKTRADDDITTGSSGMGWQNKEAGGYRDKR